MNRRTTGEAIFWGAAACALALYALSQPSGLPWQPPAAASRVWRYLVAMAGGRATTLACLSAAGAAGLLGAIVNRYLGWRAAVAAALAWIFMPPVWNGALVGERGVVIASAVVALAWAANALLLWVTRKARAMMAASGGQGLTALPNGVTAHDAHEEYAMVNRIAGWVALGVAGIFAVVSASLHDYRLGEAASAYARLVVEEAGARTILMNGLCDEQIVRELRTKNYELGMKDGSTIPHSSFVILRSSTALSLKNSEANRSNVVAFAKAAFPNETNLWLAAEISPATFAEAAVRAHPDRFYAMQGQSTTPARWEARWEAMKPYLKSRDRFIPVMRRAFAYEGNALGNGISVARQAWDIYLRVFTEIHPNNPAACVNLNEMLRRGYHAGVSMQQRIESAQADYAKLMTDRRKAMLVARYITHFGPVMRDQKAYEGLRERVRRRLEELARNGERPHVAIPDLKTLTEWHGEMMKAFQAREYDKAASIARAILSRKAWRAFVPANMVLGEKMMMEARWGEAEMLLRTAVAGTGQTAPPPMVLNDYAETLRWLGRGDEAEKYARQAVAGSDAKSGWLFRVTLAQILKQRMAGGLSGTDDRNACEGEIRTLLREALAHAPAEARTMVRREFLQ